VSAEITELTELADLLELAELFARVWERPGEPPINSDTLRALSHSGNYLSGARSAGRLVGGLVGWLGGLPPHELHLHSHILGVLAGSEARGLGFALKQHQRDWCLARGVSSIEWTFDPLVRRNAYFNLNKLGAVAERYLVNFYGTMVDGINAGEESDRLLIRWELESAGARAAAAGQPRHHDVRHLVADGARPVLDIGPDGEPLAAPLATDVALCRVPDDIVAIRREQPMLARRWREAARGCLAGAFDAGFRVEGATREGWYVLRPGAG
jgi:predicted GNAT superfamily acetyltransferase